MLQRLMMVWAVCTAAAGAGAAPAGVPASGAPASAASRSAAPPPATAASAPAAACTRPPLGGRDLYLRGTLNQWAAPEAQRFYWACDHHELVTELNGEPSFKIGDEDWSPDADLGGDPLALTPKGAAITRRFDGGLHRLELRWTGPAPALAITPCPPAPARCTPYPAPDPNASSVTDPVALSVRFDSRSTAHKRPFGAQPARSWMDFELAALPGLSKAELVIEKRRLEGNQDVLAYAEQARVPLHRLPGALDADGRERWAARYRFGAPAVYGYYFVLTIEGRRYVYANNKDTIYWTRERGSMGLGLVEEMPGETRRIRRYRQTIHAPDFTVPAWARDAVYYYVFPDRFRNGDAANDPQPGRDRYHDRSIEWHSDWRDRPYKPGSGDGSDDVYNNDFYGGDLAGLIDKLDDIRALGANALYLTPVFKAASNHKYDTADYRRIDPAFGSNADFARLSAEAARRGIRVVPDTSFNHVGADSPYFNRFSNYPAGGAFDGGRINAASPYASWFSLKPAPATAASAASGPAGGDAGDSYQGWMGVKDLPELNKASPSFRRFAYEAPDSVTRYWLDQGAAGWRMDVAPWVPDDFWRGWRQAVKRQKPDAVTLAETWFDAAKFFLGDSFDGTMNYIFRNTVLDYAAGGRAGRLYQNLELLRESYPPQALAASMNLLSTHDQPRALFHLGADTGSDAVVMAEAKRRLLLAVWFQMTWPGAPTVYYGDEVGVTGGEDPYNRAPYPWADLGGQPDEALKAQFQQLIALRQQHPVLRRGSLEAPLVLDEHLIVLLRQDGSQYALVTLSNADQPQQVALVLPPALRGVRLTDPLDGQAVTVGADGRLTVEAPALRGRVWVAP